VTVWARILKRLLYALYRQRIVLSLLLLIGVITGTYYLWLGRSNLVDEAAAAGTLPVEVTVQDLAGQVNNATLTLKEKNGTRRISMAVGVTEAIAIMVARTPATQQQQIPRDQQPQTYELMRDTIQQMGGRLDRVVVNDANQREYLAQIVVSNAGEVRVIKARPGDAVALALKAGAPIFVEDRVLDRFGIRGSG
jgi:bifunctional DNase/RNase